MADDPVLSLPSHAPVPTLCLNPKEKPSKQTLLKHPYHPSVRGEETGVNHGETISRLDCYLNVKRLAQRKYVQLRLHSWGQFSTVHFTAHN